MTLSSLPLLLPLALNPNTGDPGAGLRSIVLIALAVSAALIVLYLVTSARKKKNKKR